eukprot:scpid92934/ scgid3953/ Early growth response protein 1; Zinc finger protein Krox-24
MAPSNVRSNVTSQYFLGLPRGAEVSLSQQSAQPTTSLQNLSGIHPPASAVPEPLTRSATQTDVIACCDRTCDATFRTEDEAKRHVRAEHPERRHHCDRCAHSSKRRDHLKKHMLTHTGEKPYNCGRCNRSFARAEGLKRHGKVHSRSQSMPQYSTADLRGPAYPMPDGPRSIPQYSAAILPGPAFPRPNVPQSMPRYALQGQAFPRPNVPWSVPQCSSAALPGSTYPMPNVPQSMQQYSPDAVQDPPLPMEYVPPIGLPTPHLDATPVDHMGLVLNPSEGGGISSSIAAHHHQITPFSTVLSTPAFGAHPFQDSAA